MLASSARWLSIAARGRPLVPDVKISTARASPPRPAVALTGAPAGRGERVEARGVDQHPVGAGDRLLDDGQRQVVAEHDLRVGHPAAGRPPGAVSPVSSGTATSPARSTAKYAVTKPGEFASASATRSPRAGPAGAEPGRGGVDVGVQLGPGDRRPVPVGRQVHQCGGVGAAGAVARTTSATLVGFSLPAAAIGAVWHSRIGRQRVRLYASRHAVATLLRGSAPDPGAIAAGQASAAAADVEAALEVPLDPKAAAFFDVDNTVMQGASIFHLARASMPATSSPRATSAASPGSRASSGCSARRTWATCTRRARPRCPSRPGTPSPS